MTRLRQEPPDPDSGAPRWTLLLGAVEAAVVRSLPARLERLLGDPGANAAVIRRLFPASYADAAEEREARLLLGQSLLADRREGLACVRASLSRAESRDGQLALPLTEEDIDLWLRFVNDMRLMLATELGVEQDLDVGPQALLGPDGPRWALLEYLGGLQSLLLTGPRPELAGPFGSDAGQEHAEDDGDPPDADGDGDGDDAPADAQDDGGPP